MTKITDLRNASKEQLRDALISNKAYADANPAAVEDCLAYCRQINAEIRRRLNDVIRRRR
jgi:hypothetical protein